MTRITPMDADRIRVHPRHPRAISRGYKLPPRPNPLQSYEYLATHIRATNL